MELNKKGMVFTLTIIIILTFFTLVYLTYPTIEDKGPINKRVKTLNDLATSTEEDLSRHLFISGYRTIFILQQYTIDYHSYIDDLQFSIEEIFFNGTLEGESKSLMDDGKFSDILDSLNNNAEKINAEIYLENPSITITQLDAWKVQAQLNATLIINDKSNLASWNRTDSFVATIPITTFLDPIYHIETGGVVENKIVQTPYEIFILGSDYSNLISHFQNSYYKESTSAPDFLSRFEGNFSASVFGIESIVYPQSLTQRGLSVKYKSLIDYIYFSSSNPSIYSVPGVTNLIIDDEDNHLTEYDVSGIAIPA